MQTDAIEGPDTEGAELHLWTVDLELGAAASYTWTGYATNSIEATHAAKLEFADRSILPADQLQELVRVRGCSMVSV